jgi:hypothetical protein
MGDLIIKPEAGGSIKLQNNAGTNALVSDNSGNITVGGALGVTGSVTLSGTANNLGTVTAGSIGSSVTGFTGIKNIDIWRVHTPVSNLTGVVLANLERVDSPLGYGDLGAAMTESSGVFTFPSTGIWGIQAQFRIQESGGPFRNYMQQQITIDNGSNWNTFGFMEQGYSYYYTTTASLINFLDITDTANCKVRFYMNMAGSNEQLYGETSQTQTGFTFIRFGET